MEDKKKKKKDNVPTRYIKQPYPISAIQADLSKQQIKILVGMMDSMQEGIQEMYAKNQRNEKGQLTLFPISDADPYVYIDFKFSDVVDRPDYYSTVQAVADTFMQMVFRYEDKEAGEVTLSHFVDQVTYPQRGSKRDRIRFRFTKEQAETVFNFTMYSKYLKSVAFTAASKYTSRIYMLITSARGYKAPQSDIFHWYVSYKELRRMLGLDKKENGVWVEHLHKQYKHFKAYVLKVAEKELKEWADEGKSDCWFETIELPENFNKEPERFDFVIHLSEVGKIEEAKVIESKVNINLSERMLSIWGITEKESSKMLAGLNGEGEYQKLAGKIKELELVMEEKKEQIKDAKGYAKKCIQKFAKEIIEGRKVEGGSSSVVQTKTEPGTKGSDARENEKRVGEIQQKWLNVVGLKLYNTYVSSARLKIVGDELEVLCPHEQVVEVIKEWQEKLEATAGMKLRITLLTKK